MQYQPNQTCCGPNPVVNGWSYSECGQQLPIVPGSNPSLNYWNGQNFIVADGSNTNPIQLPYIKQASGSPQFLLGSDSQGNWSYYSGNQTSLATSIAGGSAGQIPIQTAPSTTSFVYPSSLSVASFTTASGSAPSYGIRAWAYVTNLGSAYSNQIPTAGGNLNITWDGSSLLTCTFIVPPTSSNYLIIQNTDNLGYGLFYIASQSIAGFVLEYPTPPVGINNLSVLVIF
jgi:hypothetical protein